MHEIIVIGTGPSAAGALLELKGRDVLILDVGNRSDLQEEIRRNLFDIREHDPHQDRLLIGEDFESLENVSAADAVTVKLKAPHVAFVLRDLQRFFRIETREFNPYISYAFGGLANAWGGGAYPYTDYDLRGFPLAAAQLAPYFARLDDHVGISGQEDDLYEYMGPCHGMQPAVRMGYSAANLMRSYAKARNRLRRSHISLGRTRLCVLTEPKGDRRACAYEKLSFFTCNSSDFYNPTMTINEVIRDPKTEYRPGFFVESFRQENGGVTVVARETETGAKREFRCRRLVLAAGTIGSGRMVLNSFSDTVTRLPLMENALSMIPFVDIRSLGREVDRCGYEGAVINMVYDGPLWDGKVLGSMSSFISPLRGDAFTYFPFAAKGSMALTRHILPALSVMLMFYPARMRPENYLRLQPGGDLAIHFTAVDKLGKLERKIIRSFMGLGFLSTPFLVQYTRPGNSIHYAGTVPMGREDLPYHVNVDCRLNRAGNVYLVDGSVFPALPAKNLSYTLMANAMRVAHGLKRDLDAVPSL